MGKLNDRLAKLSKFANGAPNLEGVRLQKFKANIDLLASKSTIEILDFLNCLSDSNTQLDSNTNVSDVVETLTARLRDELPGLLEQSKKNNLEEVEANYRSLEFYIAPDRLHDAKIKRQLKKAEKGDRRADALLRVIAASLLETGYPLPVLLQDFVASSLRSGVPRKEKHLWQNLARDSVIKKYVFILTQKGFRPSRNAAFRGTDDRMSACAIVAKALRKNGLNISEQAVEKVWRDPDTLDLRRNRTKHYRRNE